MTEDNVWLGRHGIDMTNVEIKDGCSSLMFLLDQPLIIIRLNILFLPIPSGPDRALSYC